VQSFVAELAAAAGRDPKDYLLEVIGPPRRISPAALADTWNHGESPERYPVDTGRLRGVVETAAREAGWGRTLPKGRGLGIAAHYSFVSYVAAVVEVAVDDQGAVTIPRVDIAVDCGATVNPERVRAQMQGAAAMGVGIATLGEMTFKGGRAEQDNFHTYQVTRMSGAPRETRVHIIPATTPSRWAASASPACRRSRRRSAMRSSRRRASGSGACPSGISSRPDN
jgi:isoquinoline 1-oxidoreductase beta subunit